MYQQPQKSNSPWLILTGIIIACLCLTCVVGSGAAYYVFSSGIIDNALATVEATENPPVPTARAATPRPNQTVVATPLPGASTPTPRANATALPPIAGPAADPASLDAAINTRLPPEDLPDLAARFKGADPSQVTRSCATASKGYDVGATRAFTVSNQDSNTQFSIKAELRYKTDNVYMWVQTGSTVKIDDTRLKRAADLFQTKVIPTNRAFFGSEANPGIDCDPHLYILHAAGIGKTVGGYFSSPDGYTRAVRGDSNEAEMFVVHAAPGYNGATPGSDIYMSTLAHEYQHMISHNTTHASSLWLEEGAAQLAERLNGYPEVDSVFEFASAPETQLNTWSESSAGENSAHYGAGYLFWSYLYDRFGDATTKALARSPERDPQTFMKVMSDAGIKNPDTGKAYTFAELFADWSAANYLGKTKANGGTRFSYTAYDPPPMETSAQLSASDYPYSDSDSVSQFGTRYIELTGDAAVTVNFKGAASVALLPAAGADGVFWWSNRGDQSNPRLTRAVDLTGVLKATLKYRTWYRMEKDWDYSYVSVSIDNGATWKIQKTQSCTTTNPAGSNLGCGYTGASGGGSAPKWINESVDLTPFSGKKILIRFELVTDAGVNREGLAIDNVEIPEVNFKDDASSAGDWKAEGFIRVNYMVPQTWSVQAILFNNDGSATVKRMTLTNNAGQLSIDLSRNAGVRKAVLAVSATTLVTTEPGTFDLQISK